MSAIANQPRTVNAPARTSRARPQRAVLPTTVASDERTAPLAMGIVEPTKKQIRERAYFIYLARRGTPGDPMQDWLLAERELWEDARMAALKSHPWPATV